MNLLLTQVMFHPRLAALSQGALNLLLVFGSITGFFSNLYNDLTAFALAMSVFFFTWSALMYMTANQNENQRVHARSSLYVALGGLALALLAQTIGALVNAAAKGQ